MTEHLKELKRLMREAFDSGCDMDGCYYAELIEKEVTKELKFTVEE